jgi:hypothetical protein
MVAAFSTGTTIVPPIIGGSNLCSIKTNFVNLIYQADLQVNGKTIESTQPFINVARHFQLLSEMNVNDLLRGMEPREPDFVTQLRDAKSRLRICEYDQGGSVSTLFL